MEKEDKKNKQFSGGLFGLLSSLASDSSSSNCISDAIYNYNAANSIYNTSSTASISTSV